MQGQADYITGGFRRAFKVYQPTVGTYRVGISRRLTHVAITPLNARGPDPLRCHNIYCCDINELTAAFRSCHAPAISWGMSGIALGRVGVIVAYNTSHLMQGKPMNRMRHHSAKALTAASALLLLGWFSIPAGDLGDTATGALESPQDAGVIKAGTADGAPTPPRRLHSSLSMPYFSFAQSLNPRS